MMLSEQTAAREDDFSCLVSEFVWTVIRNSVQMTHGAKDEQLRLPMGM